jgi:hypothetical protein
MFNVVIVLCKYQIFAQLWNMFILMEDTDMPMPFLQSNPNGAIWGNQVACCTFCPTVNSLSATNILVLIVSGFGSYLYYLHQELRIYAFHFAHCGLKLALPCLL